MENIKVEKKCEKHNQTLDYGFCFEEGCKNTTRFMCLLCAFDNHKNHKSVVYKVLDYKIHDYVQQVIDSKNKEYIKIIELANLSDKLKDQELNRMQENLQ